MPNASSPRVLSWMSWLF